MPNSKVWLLAIVLAVPVCAVNTETARCQPVASKNASSPAQPAVPPTSEGRPPGPVQAAASTEKAGDGNQDLPWYEAPWFAALITGCIAVGGTFATIRFQKHSLEKQIDTQATLLKQQLTAQRDNLQGELENALTIHKEQLDAADKRRQEEEESLRRSLVVSVAIEAIILRIRTEAYAQQLANSSVYDQITRDRIERLRINLAPSFAPEWRHANLLERALLQAQVRVLGHMVERGNRRLDLMLSYFKNDEKEFPREEIKDELVELAELYTKCGVLAAGIVDMIMKQFPAYASSIEETDQVLRVRHRSVVIPSGQPGGSDRIIPKGRKPVGVEALV